MALSKHWAAVLDDYVIDLAWTPDGTQLAAASAAGGITLFEAANGAVRHKLAGHDDGTNRLAWMPGRPDGREIGGGVPSPRDTTARPEDSPHLLASGGQDGFVRFWNAATGAQTAETKLGPAWIEHLAWRPPTGSQPAGPNAQLLFAATGKKLTALRPDGSIAHTFPDAPKTISALAVSSPMGAAAPKSSVAVSYFGGASTWDAADFSTQKDFVYGNNILALVWSPDGRWLVAGCQDNAVHLWAPVEDLELHMSGYEAKLQELSFSPNSKWLVTGGGRDACVWDCSGPGPADREPLLLPHKARVTAVAFQNQHNLAATGTTDGEFGLWSPTHRNPLVATVKLPSAVTKFAWRHDDGLLAAGTENGTVFVFKL